MKQYEKSKLPFLLARAGEIKLELNRLKSLVKGRGVKK
jgi:hypothetical protein